MRNIIWTLPDGSITSTGLSPDSETLSQQSAIDLQSSGIVPNNWIATAFDQEIA